MIDGNRTINGSFGTLNISGNRIAELSAFSAKLTKETVDILKSGSLGVDEKLVGVKGEGSFTLKQVYTRFMADAVALQGGKNIKHTLVGIVDDPDAFGIESIVIEKVNFKEIFLMEFKAGEVSEREIPFTFSVTDFIPMEQVLDPSMVTGSE